MKRRTFLACLPLFSAGCFLKDFTTVARPQLDEPEPSASSVKVIGDMSADWDNAAEMVVSGYGLVTGLNGTGGVTPPCEARTTILERLRRAKIENPADVLDSPDSAVVIVSAIVKPGIRRDEVIDVEVSLPYGSKVKSLRGGILQPTPLITFASQSEVREHVQANGMNTFSEGNRLLKGQEVALAAGPIQSSLVKKPDDPPAEQGMKRGYVWKGARMLEGRAMYLVLRPEHQRFRVAEQVAIRINESFHAGDSAATKVASARHKDLVAVAVPPRYRLNRPHYMRVVWAVPMSTPSDMESYIREWEEKLNNPETAQIAAIRFEALGAAGIPPLKGALTSSYPLVRFAAAEALAYLGNTAGADELQKSAIEHPALQAYALTALAALDDALGMSKLEELLTHKKPELRYGAFRAYREIDPTSDLVRGQRCKHAFMLHEVVVPGPSMIHLLREGRSEVVLFGEAPKLVPPFSLMSGNITVTARKDDEVATISAFSAQSAGSPNHVQCSLNIAEVMRQLAAFGATYADAAEILQKADDRKALSCPLVFDALPKAVAVKRLAEAARQDPHMEQETDLLREVDAASTPGLFTRAEQPARRE